MPDDLTMVKRTLTWVLYSSRPLKLRHLNTAASVDPKKPFSEDQKLEDCGYISDHLCSQLIQVDSEDHVVEFSHFSVSQFLQMEILPDGTQNIYYLDVAEGNALIMRSCFMYLRNPDFNSTILSRGRNSQSVFDVLKTRLADHLAFYAIYEWSKHAKKLKTPKSQEDIFSFLKESSRLSWCELYEVEALCIYPWWEEKANRTAEESWWSNDIMTELTSAARYASGNCLYYASLLGFHEVVKMCSDDPNECGGPNSYPLLAALKNGHLNVARLLLEKGADINIRDFNRGYTALHDAVQREDIEAIKFLIDGNADLNVRNSRQQPPLHLAVTLFVQQSQTKPEIMELLSNGDCVNVLDTRGRTALHLSVRLGSLSAVKILVERGIAINACDISGRTALHTLALNGGGLDLLDYLLTLNNSDLTISDNLGYTALHLAVKFGHPKMVSNLSEAINEPIQGLERIEPMTAKAHLFLSLINCEGG